MSEIVAPVRSERQVWAAPGSSHDRLIHMLNWVLPVLIGVLTAFLVMAPLTVSGDVSFVLDKKKVEVAHERLKIQSATYRGEDGKGQPFALEAGSAVQKSSAEPIVQIKTLAAQLKLPDGPATITSPGGQYNMDTEQVGLHGPIKVRAADGYALDTDSATIDLQTRKLESGGAVTGRTSQGVFSANKLRADLAARTVTLDGNARLRIVPRATK